MIAAALALMMSSGAAMACDSDMDTSLKIQTIEMQLGDILGSKAACGVEYDDDAVEAFMIKTVKGPLAKCMDESDGTFANMVGIYTDLAKTTVEQMSKPLLAAHCVQIRRVAKQHGFTK
jgi:hypothetical protein